MPEAVVAIMSVFAVYGLISIIREICTQFLVKAGESDRIVIYVKSNTERIEGVVRSLMIKNPGAEIIVTSKDKGGEVREIIDKLSRDYGRIHIGRLEIKSVKDDDSERV